jgi:hypothetical protein
MTEKTEKPDSNDVVNTATEQQEQGFDIEMSAAKTEFMKDVKLLVAENTASQRAFLSSAIVEHA